jgi:hypothetical protein
MPMPRSLPAFFAAFLRSLKPAWSAVASARSNAPGKLPLS